MKRHTGASPAGRLQLVSEAPGATARSLWTWLVGQAPRIRLDGSLGRPIVDGLDEELAAAFGEAAAAGAAQLRRPPAERNR